MHPKVRIVGVQPLEEFNCQEGLRNVDKSIPPEIFDRSVLDEILEVADKEAIVTARSLVRRCGLMCGTSSGSILCGALRLVRLGAKGNFVMIFPDRGEKYLSTPLYTTEIEERELAVA